MNCNYCDNQPDREPYSCCEECRKSRLKFSVYLPDDGKTPWYRRVLKDTPAALLPHYLQNYPGCEIEPNTEEAKAFLAAFNK